MDRLFEPAADGELEPGLQAVFEAHVGGCRRCRGEWETAQLMAAELAGGLTGFDEAEERSLQASRRAINRIEPGRRAALSRARRSRRFRALWLLLGWIGAALMVVKAGAIAEMIGQARLEQVLRSPTVEWAASMFSVTPLVLGVGVVLLAVVSVFSLRLVLADD
jgi:anti-sigma factor RsiW